MTDPAFTVRRAETRDVADVLALWAAARSEHARTEDRAAEVER